MCIGCGVCQFADPTVEVRLDPKKLIYEPIARQSNAAAASVCPAVAVDFEGLQAWLLPRRRADDVRRRALGAARPEHRPRPQPARPAPAAWSRSCSSTTSTQPDVDGVLALGHVGGIDFETRLVTEPDEASTSCPGRSTTTSRSPERSSCCTSSRAVTCSWRSPASSRASSATSAPSPPSCADQIHTTIGLLCGWQYSHHALRAIADFKKHRPRRRHRHLVPRRGTGRAAADVDRRRGARGRPARRLRLPGRLRPLVQHAALPHLRQPLATTWPTSSSATPGCRPRSSTKTGGRLLVCRTRGHRRARSGRSRPTSG